MEGFCKSSEKCGRRVSREVAIGGVVIGGGRPVAVQSMTDCSTLDTAACVGQIGRLREAGCRIVRLTVQGPREAQNLQNIKREAAATGYGDVALVADIHFAPKTALLAAEHADKVRINPGNFGGPGADFLALLAKCRRRGIPIRIGVNHGSLAPHIVERWGDTPRGMVESAMEYLCVCRAEGFGDVVVSMKSSNVRVMVHAYRLLAAEMDAEGMDFPLHLGVTEAGDGADGRIKSAVGIGALMADGLGDTIRVSLTEPPENEIPVAKALVSYFATRDGHEIIENETFYSPCEYRRRETVAVGNIGGGRVPVLWGELDGQAREGVAEGSIAVLESVTADAPAEWRARILGMMASGDRRPLMLAKTYGEESPDNLQIKAAADFGMAFIDGLADGLRIENPGIPQNELAAIALSILQAARIRMSRTEYIACPGCGRTLYDLQGTLAAIRRRTSHLAGLKIGVMGCIVNGPGEMADADYGYVGEGGGRVTIYRGREVVCRAVPQTRAVDALIDVIKAGGQWRDPETCTDN